MSMALTSMQGSLEAAVQVVDQGNQDMESTHADKANVVAKMREPVLSLEQ